MLGMAKENYGWDSSKPYILVQYFLLDLNKLYLLALEEKSICGAMGDKTSRWYRKGAQPKSEKSGTILIALRPSCSASVSNIWNGVEV
jgi:hypothetical protein